MNKPTSWLIVIVLGVISGIVCGIAVNMSHAKDNTLLYVWAVGNIGAITIVKPTRRLVLYAIVCVVVGFLAAVVHSKGL